MTSIKESILLCAMALGAVACAADVDDASTNEDGPEAPVAMTDEPGRDVSALNLGAPGTSYNLAERGGSGGSPAPTLRSSVIYGMRLNTGSRVDQISLAYYIPSNADNQYRAGDYYATMGPLGGNGGTWHDWTYCPGGFGAVGIQGRSGSRVDGLGLICANATTGAGMQTLTVYGGSGGQGFYDVCQTGYLMTGINARSGSNLDRIQGICQKR